MDKELYKSTDISSILKIEMLNILVSDIVRWEQYEGYLKDLNDYLTLDFSIYDALTNKMPVITAMINQGKFDTIEQVKTKFIAAVNAQKSVEDTPKKPQSSGGSGSSGGISVSPKLIQATTPAQEQSKEQKAKFTDVDKSFWGFDAVNFLSEKGVINGFEDGSFKPNEKITREQFAKIIAVAFSLKANSEISNFSDISVDSWSYSYVSAVFGSGTMKGITDHYFGANQNVTREQMATIVYRASKNANITLEKTRDVSYTDEFQISDYAKESILALSGAEIINGAKNGYFEPQELCTRVQIAKILYEVLGGK
jgi:hypothetical protein